MHRFFISSNELQKSGFQSSDKELCHQVSKVLKFRPGEKTILCDNTEQELLVEWTTISRSLCEAKLLEKNHRPDISTEKAVHLFVPPLKNQARWELILEKGTEIGVASFTPLITERTEVRELRKLDRLERIVKEAAEQSGRTKLPVIHPPLSFAEALKNSQEHPATNLIAILTKEAKHLGSYKLQTTPYHLFLGPVGDFSPEEVEQAIEHNFYPISLGSQILRTETAALVGAAVLLTPSDL